MSSKRFRHIGEGHAEQLGADRTINGNFSTGNLTGWINADSAWSVVNNQAVCDGTGAARLYQNRLTIGIRYRLSFDVIAYTSGSLTGNIGSSTGPGIDADGIGSYTVIGPANNVYIYFAETVGTFIGTIDNIVCNIVLVEETQTILDVSANSGSIIDRWGNTLINTAMSVFKDGDVRVMEFNGSTSIIDMGVPNTLVGDKSFIAWIKPRTWGESESGTIFSNGKCSLYLQGGASQKFWFSSDGSTNVSPGGVILSLRQPYLIGVIREADGNAIFYLDGEDTGSSGDSGTPAAGTTNLIVGNNAAGSQTFEGLIDPLIIIDGLLTEREFSQIYTSTKHLYQK